jgi:hypothetical protein
MPRKARRNRSSALLTSSHQTPGDDSNDGDGSSRIRRKEHKKGTTMKNLLLSSLGAGALAATALGLTATANAAPAGPSSVDATIDQLRARGYDVIVNRVGTVPAEQCTVSAVRPGQTFSRTDTGSGQPGAWDDLVTTVTSNTVYVDVIC